MPTKIKDYAKVYYQINRQGILDQQKEYRSRNRERRKVYYQAYYRANGEKVLKAQKDYRNRIRSTKEPRLYLNSTSPEYIKAYRAKVRSLIKADPVKKKIYDEYQNKHRKSKIDNLADVYIRQLIRMSYRKRNMDIPSNIPVDLIKAKRELLRVKRLLTLNTKEIAQ